MQRNDCRRWMQIRNKGTWKVMQQTTWHQKRDRDELGSRECDKLGLQSLSGGFRLRLRIQNLIDRPNIMQSRYDTTINPKEGGIHNSTINPWNSKVRNRQIAGARNEMTISKFSVTVPTKPNPKHDPLVIVLGLS